MASITFGAMQTRVGEIINQLVSDDTQTVTNTMVKAWINIGYSKAVNAIVSAYEDYYLRLSKANLVEGQDLYSLPADCRKLVRLRIGYVNGTDVTNSKFVNIHSIIDPTVQRGQSYPIHSIIDDAVMINPAPSADVAEGLHLFYIEDPDELTNANDEPRLPRGFHHLPILYAISKAKKVLGLEEEAKADLKEFEDDVAVMAAQILSRSGPDTESVEIVELYSEV